MLLQLKTDQSQKSMGALSERLEKKRIPSTNKRHNETPDKLRHKKQQRQKGCGRIVQQIQPDDFYFRITKQCPRNLYVKNDDIEMDKKYKNEPDRQGTA